MARFSSGKNSWSISERSGMRFPYREMIKEPGTNLWIHKSESDGMYNRVDHPQNHIKAKSDSLTLRNIYTDPPQLIEYLVDGQGNRIISLEMFGMISFIRITSPIT